MWLNYLENSINKLLFSNNLATWLNVTLRSVKTVSEKTRKKIEQEDENRAINVRIVNMFGYQLPGKR